jgi:hypothetical protein
MSTLHDTTFGYLKPTDAQMETMNNTRALFKVFVANIDDLLPAGPDKTYVLRQLRDCAMWANIAITRNPDGSPRS